MRLAAAGGVEDGLIQDHRAVADLLDGGVGFLQVGVSRVEQLSHGSPNRRLYQSPTHPSPPNMTTQALLDWMKVMTDVGERESALLLIECNEGPGDCRRICEAQRTLHDNHSSVWSTFIVEPSAQSLEVSSIPSDDAATFRGGSCQLFFICPALATDVVNADDIKAEPSANERNVRWEILVDRKPHRRASRRVSDWRGGKVDPTGAVSWPVRVGLWNLAPELLDGSLLFFLGEQVRLDVFRERLIEAQCHLDLTRLQPVEELLKSEAIPSHAFISIDDLE